MSPDDYKGSELKVMWDKRKLKKARQRKRLIKQGESVNECANNSSHSDEMKATQSVQVPKKVDRFNPGNRPV